jgi:hypothetical protein
MNIFDHTNTYFTSICTSSSDVKTANTGDSISSLLNVPLTQSQCIKFGTHVEKILRDFISSYHHVKNVRPQNKKGESERDHLFLLDDGRKIYAELKCNLNLDTEKRKKTCEKVHKISKEEECEGYLLAVRYIDEIPEKVAKQYDTVNLVSVSQYFKLFNVSCPFGNSELLYRMWLNQIARELVCRDEDLDVRIQRLKNDIAELKRLKL